LSSRLGTNQGLIKCDKRESELAAGPSALIDLPNLTHGYHQTERIACRYRFYRFAGGRGNRWAWAIAPAATVDQADRVVGDEPEGRFQRIDGAGRAGTNLSSRLGTRRHTRYRALRRTCGPTERRRSRSTTVVTRSVYTPFYRQRTASSSRRCCSRPSGPSDNAGRLVDRICCSVFKSA
jgi:hypothetical protein